VFIVRNRIRNRLAADAGFDHDAFDVRGPVVTVRKALQNPVDTQVGARLRTRRLLLGVSQEELGKAVGVSFQQIQKYEKGTNRIGASRLQRLAHALQVPIAYFFQGMSGTDAPDTEGDHIMAFLGTAQGLALAKSFMRIKNPTIRRRIAEFVTAIAED
jgi:transcriptional regulator with XRE-family HTH domain